MLRNTPRTPSYRLHRASGQAVVTLAGQDHYLGLFGSKESRHAYDRAVSEWLARGRAVRPRRSAYTVSMLLAAYWSFLSDNPHKRQTLEHARAWMKLVKPKYGLFGADEFGPVALNVVRKDMIAQGWSRTYINQQTGRIRRAFQWAVGNQMVPADCLTALQALEGLRFGQSQARETEAVKPVSWPFVEQMIQHCPPTLEAMIRIQWLTGMRPGELCSMRGCDLDTTQAVWVYRPASHKTQHRGHSREIFLGPQAQAILRPLLKPDLQAPIFSPADADQQRREKKRLERKTPEHQGNRPGTNRKRHPKRTPGRCYNVGAYRKAIEYACLSAFPFPIDTSPAALDALTPDQRLALLAERRRWYREHRFHPHQLRHSAATEIRKRFGLQGAQVILGHKSLSVTQVYAECDEQSARRIAGEVG